MRPVLSGRLPDRERRGGFAAFDFGEARVRSRYRFADDADTTTRAQRPWAITAKRDAGNIAPGLTHHGRSISMFGSEGNKANSILRSIASATATVQIVGTPGRGVLLDLQSRNFDTAGCVHEDHAIAMLPLDTAERLLTALNDAVLAASGTDTYRQPGLWSDTALQALARAAA